MKKILFIAIGSLVCADFSFGQALGDFRSFATGNWDALGSWEEHNGSVWVAANNVPGTADGRITIRSTHNITIPATVSITTDQTEVLIGGTLTVASTGTLTIANGADITLGVQTGDFIAENDDFGSSGTLSVSGTVILNDAANFDNLSLPNNTSFLSGSTYELKHTVTQGELPWATWNAASTVLITGYTTTALILTSAGNWSQSIGNFTYNCASQGAGIVIDYAGLLNTINGNVAIQATGTGRMVFTTTTNYTLTVSGTFSCTGTANFRFSSSSGVPTVTITGAFTYSSTSNSPFIISAASGTLTLSSTFGISAGTFTLSTTGTCTANFNGLVTVSGGALTLSTAGAPTVNFNAGLTLSGGNLNVSTSSATQNPTVNVTGAYTQSTGTVTMCTGLDRNVPFNLMGSVSFTGGTITETSIALGTGEINFAGTVAQTYTSGGTFSGSINFTANNLSIVDLGTSALSGIGNFTSQANSTLRIGHTAGLDEDAGIGAIQVTGTRTYTAATTITYNGSSAQDLGDSWGIDVELQNVNLTIDNVSGVSLSGAATIGTARTLTLTSGNLTVGANTLTINGAVAFTTGTLNSASTSILTIGGTGALGTIPFAGGAQLNDLTINRTSSGTLTFTGNVEVTDIATFTEGILTINGITLTFSGTGSTTLGTITGNAASTIIINGTGAFGTINMTAATTVGTLTVNRTASGTATIGNAFTVNSTLNLTAGDLTATSVTMAAASTINRTTGTISAIPTAATSWNVIYLGTVTTGNELPSLSTALNDLTVNGGFTATLGKAITVNGTVTITGTLASGGFNITSLGNWTNNGTFTHGSATVSFTGTAAQAVSGTAITDFYNFEVNTNLLATTVSVTSTQRIINKLIPTRGTLDVTAGDTIIIESTAAATTGRVGVITAGTSSISATSLFRVRQFIPAAASFHWKMLSAPVRGAGVTFQMWNDTLVTTGIPNSDEPGTSTVSIKRYIERNLGTINVGFEAIDDMNNGITPGRGYFVIVEGKTYVLEATGNLNTGTFNFDTLVSNSSTGDPAADGWCMLGNPFACPVDWSLFTPFNVATTYQKRLSTGGYVGWNAGIPDADGSGATRWIGSTQGFWIQTNGASPTLTVGESAKAPDATTAFQKTPLPEGLKLNVDGYGYSSRAWILFGNDGKDSLDKMWDGEKFYATRGAGGVNKRLPEVVTYSADGYKLEINSMPPLTKDMSIPVQITVGDTGQYTISLSSGSFSSNSSCLILEDLYDSTMTDMRTTNTYSFKAYDTAITARFILHLGMPLSKNSTPVSCNGAKDATVIVKGNGVGPWTYTWWDVTDTNFIDYIRVIQRNSADTLYGVGAGKYKIIVQGGQNFCAEVSDTITVGEPDSIKTSIQKSDVACSGDKSGSINLTVSGGVPPYAYKWLPGGQTTEDLSGLSGGTYSVTITDAVNCIINKSDSVYEKAPILLSFTLSADTVYTEDGATVKLTNTSSGAASYSWIFGDGTPVGNGDTVTHAYSYPGTYFITLTGKNTTTGCPDTTLIKPIVVLQKVNVEEIGYNNGVIKWYSAGRIVTADFDLDKQTNVTISVINVLGQNVVPVRSVKVFKEKINVELPQAQGIYFIRVQSDQFTVTEKFVR